MKKIAAERNYRMVKMAETGLTPAEYRRMVESDFNGDVWDALDWFYKRAESCTSWSDEASAIPAPTGRDTVDRLLLERASQIAPMND